MGEVYQATDTKLKRQVAIKVLPASVAADTERLARFQREAEVLASLNHPNIAIIHGLEQTGDVHALVMELVEGDDLSQRIARGAIPVDEALPIAKQIAEALEAAHEQGIIHRDLKPANIKVRPDGTVKVLDFGLAKALEPTSAMSPGMSQAPTITTPAMTQAGMILGTAAYMSPEQAKGRTVDRRSDVWAFGAVIYEMLTGMRAFGGDDTTDTLANVLKVEPNWTLLPKGLSPVLGTYIRRCLHKDAKQRVGDVQDVRLALEGAFEDAIPEPSKVGAMVRPAGWRRTGLVALAGVVISSLVTGLAVWNLRAPEPGPVVRFDYDLPEDHVFRNINRSVMAFSADSRHFVYNTTQGLYLRAMGELEARLVPGTEGSLQSPFFSPDGQWVGYHQDGQLKKMAIDGGAPVIICAAGDPLGVNWAVDDSILFGQYFGQYQGVMRVSADGGTPELIIPAADGELIHGPQLLPDGDSVLFSVTRGSGLNRWNEAQIVVHSLGSGQRTVLLEDGSDARYVPTGHLVYALGDALFAVRFDADSLQVIGGPVSVAEGVMRAAGFAGPSTNVASANYGFSDQGALVYVLGASAPQRTLVWVDREGQEEPVPVEPRAYTYPRISPGGTRVALQVGDQEEDIWIWDFARETSMRLTFDPGSDEHPVWTPDGERVVFSSAREGGPRKIFWKAADGTGAVERITDGQTDLAAYAFSPGGQRLVLRELREMGPNGDLVVLSMTADRTLEPLIATPSSELNADVSPDGRWLAYESDASGQSEVYVRPFPNVDDGQWLVSTDGGTRPRWSPTGRDLFYLHEGRLFVAPVTTGATFTPGNPEMLFEGAFDGVAGRTYDVSPDGERFLIIKQADATSEMATAPRVIIVENWFEELQRLVPTN